MRTIRGGRTHKIRNELRSETKKQIDDKSPYIPSVKVANQIRVFKEYLRDNI